MHMFNCTLLFISLSLFTRCIWEKRKVMCLIDTPSLSKQRVRNQIHWTIISTGYDSIYKSLVLYISRTRMRIEWEKIGFDYWKKKNIYYNIDTATQSRYGNTVVDNTEKHKTRKKWPSPMRNKLRLLFRTNILICSTKTPQLCYKLESKLPEVN